MKDSTSWEEMTWEEMCNAVDRYMPQFESEIPDDETISKEIRSLRNFIMYENLMLEDCDLDDDENIIELDVDYVDMDVNPTRWWRRHLTPKELEHIKKIDANLIPPYEML